MNYWNYFHQKKNTHTARKCHFQPSCIRSQKFGNSRYFFSIWLRLMKKHSTHVTKMYYRGQKNIFSINLFIIFWIFLLLWYKWELLLLFLNKLFLKYSCVNLCCKGLKLHLTSIAISQNSHLTRVLFSLQAQCRRYLCQQKQGFLCSKQFPPLALQASLKEFFQKSKGWIWKHTKSISRLDGENVCLQERICIRNLLDVYYQAKESYIYMQISTILNYWICCLLIWGTWKIKALSARWKTSTGITDYYH